MAESYNRTILMGNLTRKPRLRHTANGKPVCNIGLAVNDRRKQGDEWVDTVHFIDLTLWGRKAEVANEYLDKGSRVLVEGRLQQENWLQNDESRSRLIVVVDQLKLLGSRQADAEDTAGSHEGAAGNEPADANPEEVHF